MKKMEVYVCEICNGQYSSEIAATLCERDHRSKDEMEIKSVWFQPSNGLYGMELAMAQKVPKKVTIKFSEDHGDFATYVLDHYGYKGV